MAMAAGTLAVSDGGPPRVADPSLPAGPALAPERQARLWMETPADLLDGGARAFGDRFTIRLGRFGTLVIVHDPDGIAEVMALPSEAFHCRPFNESYRYAMGDHALFLADGAPHRRLKTLLARALGGIDGDAHAAAIQASADAALATWRASAGAVTLRPWAHEVTLGALAGLVFGPGSAAADRLLRLVRDACWGDLRSWKPWTALSRKAPEIVALVEAEIAARRASGTRPDGGDLLDRLMAAPPGEGPGLSDAEIADQVRMLSITAGDAVAVALAWALLRLAERPDLQAALREEAAAGGARPLMEAVICEVLRLHTVLPTVSGRALVEECDLLGHRLPAGVTVAPCEYLAHRRADLWDDPLAFRPERFLEAPEPPRPPAYFPFGFGARACLGAVFVPRTLRVVLDAVLSRFALGASGGWPRTVRHGTLLAPSESAGLIVSPLGSEGQGDRPC